MQLSGIYRWAKAQHKDLVYAEGLSEVPSASRWIKFRLLPKLEEALHTSSNKRIKQGAKRPHAKRTS